MQKALLVALLLATTVAVSYAVPQSQDHGLVSLDEARSDCFTQKTCTCVMTDDCANVDQICEVNTEDPTQNRCAHKPLFPFNGSDWLGVVLGLFFTAVAAGGGIGGGGLLVPVLVIAVGFSTREAIPLSKATIFGGAIANLIFNIKKRHPAADRPITDYSTALILEPLTLAGTIIGVLFNKLSPEWLIIILLVLTLGFSAYRTGQKGIKLYREETGAAATTKAPEQKTKSAPVESEEDSSSRNVAFASLQEDELEMADLEDSHDSEDKRGAMMDSNIDSSSSDTDYGKEQELKAILEKEKKNDWHCIWILFGAWLWLLVLALLQGGEGAHSLAGVKMYSAPYFLLFFLALISLVVLSYYIAKKLHKEWERKLAIGYKFQKGDVQWTKKALTVYPALCTIAGILAGMIGIGGGMIKGPIMLEMNMLAQVVAATSSFMILFTSSSTTMQFMVLGMLQWDYGLFYAVLGFVGTVIGQLGINYLVQKYKKTYFIVLSITLVVGISAILMPINAFLHIRKK